MIAKIAGEMIGCNVQLSIRSNRCLNQSLLIGVNLLRVELLRVKLVRHYVFDAHDHGDQQH